MGAVYSSIHDWWYGPGWLGTDDGTKEKTPVKGNTDRCANMWKNNWRGLIGSFLILISFCTMFSGNVDKAKNTGLIWLMMFWTLLIHPLYHGAAGLIPVAFAPMFGLAGTVDVLGVAFNQGVFHFVIGSYLIMLFNCSGLDKRIAMRFLNFKNNTAVSTTGLIMRVSLASVILGAFSCKRQSTKMIMKIVCPVLENLQSTTKGAKDEVNYRTLKYHVCNAICSSMCIGGSSFIHSSLNVLGFRALYQGLILEKGHQTDPFNFLSYSMFAIPMCFVAFILNMGVIILQTKLLCKGKISPEVQTDFFESVKKRSTEEVPPKMTTHEKLSIAAMIVLLIGHLSRWSRFGGWSWHYTHTFSTGFTAEIPKIHDATYAALMFILFNNIPAKYEFIKKVKNLKKGEYARGGRPTSGILYWKTVDKAFPYIYMFLLCGAMSLNYCIAKHLANGIKEFAAFLTEMDWNVGILLIILGTVFLSNIMTSMGALVIIEPFILYMVDSQNLSLPHSSQSVWEQKMHLAAMGVGIATSFGFCGQFRHTPMHHSFSVGRIPILKQIKSALASVIVCTFVLYIFLAFLGEILLSDIAATEPKSP